MGTFWGRLAYDGTGYHGFQYQSGVPTIQAVLEESLSRFARLEGRVAGAGRTDTGVHAAGQVISVEVDWRHGAGALQEAWNAHLPPDIHLRQMVDGPVGYHPRFDAVSRMYRYSVVHYDGSELPKPRRSPLTDRYALFENGQLDVDAMNCAAALLHGEHDFAAFGWPTQGESTVRKVLAAEWVVQRPPGALDEYPGRQVVFTIAANGFLRRMVRVITGTLLDVGRGYLSVAQVAQIMATKDRGAASPSAPANALVLERVDYPAALSLW